MDASTLILLPGAAAVALFVGAEAVDWVRLQIDRHRNPLPPRSDDTSPTRETADDPWAW